MKNTNIEFVVSQYVGVSCFYIRRIWGPYTKTEEREAFECFQEENEADSYIESNMSPIWEWDEDAEEDATYTVFGTDGYHNLVCRSYICSNYEEMEEMFYREFPDGDIATYDVSVEA